MQLPATVREPNSCSAIFSYVLTTSQMAEAIDLEQPLLDVGMNSMQLTLLVSILRAEAGSNFSIGDLLMLPVIRCLFCWLLRF